MTNVIISLDDLITIPSGKEYPEDYTDFRVNISVINAILDFMPSMVTIVDTTENLSQWGTESEAMARLKSIGFFVFEATFAAVSNFLGKNIADAVEQYMERIKEKESLIFVGMENEAKKHKGIYISLEDFKNGRFTSHTDYKREEGK